MYAAYDFFDQKMKGYIELAEIKQAIQENSLLSNDADPMYAFSILDIQAKGRVTREDFIARLCMSSQP